MIGTYESDDGGWKLRREPEGALAENALAEAVPAEGARRQRQEKATQPISSWRHVRVINMEDAGAVKGGPQLRHALVSQVFRAASAAPAFSPGHEDIIALAAEANPLINPGRAHHFEIDKRLATETLRNAGITAPAIIAWGTPAELGRAAADLDDSRSVALSREEASEAWSSRASEAEIASHRWPRPTPDQWTYPCIIKPNCGGRTTHTAVLRSPAAARAFLSAAPNLVFIVEPYIEAVGGFLTRIEVVDGRIALVVKRSVAASGLSSYHEGSTYELYPDCPAAVTDAVLEAARILDIQFGSFDVIEAAEGNFIIDANSVSNVSEDCTELFGFDLMAAYTRALAARYRTLRNATN